MKTHPHNCPESLCSFFQGKILLWTLILALLVPLPAIAKSPKLSPILAGKDILFVVGNTNLNPGDGDYAVKSQLETVLGHTVTLLDDDAASISALSNRDLILISSTVSSSKLAGNFGDAVRDGNTAVVTWEHAYYDDLDMSVSGNMQESSGFDLDILLTGHPLIGEAGATVDAFSATAIHAVGNPSTSAIRAASLPSGNLVYFAYESGSQMISMAAPGRRIGLFLGNTSANDLTANGWALFNGAICWALEECGNTAPTANLIAFPISGPAPLAVNFDGSSSTDPQNDPLSYAWDFNDGATATGVNTSHTFLYPGNYQVNLTVDDGQGLSDQKSVTITVSGNSNYSATGELLYERFDNLSSYSSIADLQSHAAYPSQPDHSQVLTDFARMPNETGDMFGAKLSGQYIAPQTGTYYFAISADDISELWLSTNHSPVAKQRIAFNNSPVPQNNYSTLSSQLSGPVQMIAGHAYYLEALMVESFGGQHLSIQIQLPDNSVQAPVSTTDFVLPGTYPPPPSSVYDNTFMGKYGEENDGEYIVTQLATGNYLVLGAGLVGGSEPLAAGNIHGIELDPYGNLIDDFIIEVPGIDFNSSQTFKHGYQVMDDGDIVYMVESSFTDGAGTFQACATGVFRLDPTDRSIVYSRVFNTGYCHLPVVAGKSIGGNSSYFLTSGGQLIKLGPTGAISLSRDIAHRYFKARDMITFNNNEMMIIGGYAEATGNPINDTRLVAIKLDTNGEDLWAKTYELTNGESIFAQSIATHNDGSSMIAGKVIESGQEKLMLVKLDASGAIISNQSYDLGLAGEWEVPEIQVSSDGGFMLAGGTSQLGNDGLTHPFLAKISASAQLEWFHLFDTGLGESARFYTLESSSDGGWIASGGEYASGSGAGHDFPGFVVKTDGQGRLTGDIGCHVSSIGLNAFSQGQLSFLPATDFSLALGAYNAAFSVPASNIITVSNTILHPADWTIELADNCPANLPECENDPLVLASPTINTNRIISRTFRTEVQNADDILNHPADFSARDLQEGVAYLDGLGRSQQSIVVQGSPDLRDIVAFNEYDPFGREKKQYLPYPDANTAGSLRNQVGTAQATEIQNYFPGEAAFAETEFEASPLNRVIEQGAFGNSWQIIRDPQTLQSDQSGHTIKTSYLQFGSTEIPSVLEVPYFPLDATPGTPINWNYNYLAATNSPVQVMRTENENGALAFSFIDDRGLAIMSSTQVDDNGTPNDIHDDIYASTYNIYDHFGNLKYVLQPEGFKELMLPGNQVLTQDLLDRFAFQYVYNERQQVVEKKVPGAGWMYMVYNELGQLILSQDANQRSLPDFPGGPGKDEWTFTKYDNLDRPILTGIYDNLLNSSTSNYDRVALQTHVLTHPIHEHSSAVLSFDQTGESIQGYSNIAFPDLGHSEVLSITFYDDYDFDRDQASDAKYWPEPDIPDNQAFSHLRGLVTAVLVKVLDPHQTLANDPDTYPTFLRTVTFYDDRLREIQTQSQHLRGMDISTHQVNFAGEILTSIVRHAGPTGPIRVKNTFCYDHLGHVIRVTQQNNNDPEIVLAAESYDPFGRLVEKNLHDTDGSGTALQSIDYAYNIRGWMTDINEVTPGDCQSNNPENDLFRFRLHYDDAFADASLTYSNKALYNGNISWVEWQTGDDCTTKAYAYSYDQADRILNAQYAQTACQQAGPSGAWACPWDMPQLNSSIPDWRSNYSFDLNGNLLSLQRYGKTGTGSQDFGLMDDLMYSYAGSNRLTQISDQVSASLPDVDQFVDGTNTGVDYIYDDSGNIITDHNKGMTAEYNHLNKPTLIQLPNGSMEFVYSATGVKLQARVNGTSSKTRDYINGFQYEEENGNTSLAFFQHGEGRVIPDGSGGFSYEYHLSDHLGNNRVMFADDGSGSPVIQQANDYYAFGLSMSGTDYQVANPTNDYLYSGKERHEELGLEWYDYGARMYDASIGRWNGVDAMSEKYLSYGSYIFTVNNPIRYIDPDGNMVTEPPSYLFQYSILEHDFFSPNDPIVSATFRIQLIEEEEGIAVNIQSEGSDDNEGVSLVEAIDFTEKTGEIHLTLTMATSDIENENETNVTFSLSSEASQTSKIVPNVEQSSKTGIGLNVQKTRKQKFASNAAHIVRTFSFGVSRNKEGTPILKQVDNNPRIEQRDIDVPTSIESSQSPWGSFEGSTLELLIIQSLVRTK
ncbi:MAG: DUF6443 domain-containing protein [Bacteroidota bacterium]